MASTHTSLRIHITFSTKDRFPLIGSTWREGLHEYLGGCVRGLGAKPLQVGGVADHVHLLIGIRPTHAIADLVREVKKASNAWSAQFENKFQWQDGYGAFSVSGSDVERVRSYIEGQSEHHRRVTFQEEYMAFLKAEGIEYDERFLW